MWSNLFPLVWDVIVISKYGAALMHKAKTATLLANTVLQISPTLRNIAPAFPQLNNIATHHYTALPKMSLEAFVNSLGHPRVTWAIPIMVLGVVAAKNHQIVQPYLSPFRRPMTSSWDADLCQMPPTCSNYGGWYPQSFESTPGESDTNCRPSHQCDNTDISISQNQASLPWSNRNWLMMVDCDVRSSCKFW